MFLLPVFQDDMAPPGFPSPPEPTHIQTHCLTISRGKDGVMHLNRTYLVCLSDSNYLCILQALLYNTFIMFMISKYSLKVENYACYTTVTVKFHIIHYFSILH